MLLLAACGDESTPPDEPGSGTLETTVEPTSAATALTSPAELDGDLQSGTEAYDVRLPGLSSERLIMTVTLPEGWTGVDGWTLRKNGGVGNREGIAITLWAPPAFVYGDSCQWNESAVEVEPTVDFMADALAMQAMRNASTPRDLVVGRHRVVEIQLSVPDDLDLSTCDLYEGSPYFQSWASADGSIARYHQGPGQRDLVRLVDVDGQLLIIDVATWPELPAEEHDQIASLLDSMAFELANR